MVNKEGEEYEEGCGCGEGAAPFPEKCKLHCYDLYACVQKNRLCLG